MSREDAGSSGRAIPHWTEIDYAHPVDAPDPDHVTVGLWFEDGGYRPQGIIGVR